MTRSARGALTGGAAGLVVVSLMLRGTLTAGFPVVALALWERALRLLPMEVFGFIIVRLKFLAKPAAFWGMLGALIAGAAFLGWLLGRAPWNRRPSRGAGAAAVRSTATFLAGFALTFVPLIALAFSSATEYLRGRLEGMGVLNPAPAALTGQVIGALAAYAVIFALPVAVATSVGNRGAGRRAQVSDQDLNRRELLRRSLVLALGVLTGSALARVVLSSGHRAVAYAQEIFARIKGLPAEITPTDQFYVVSKNPPGFDPVLDGGAWRLEVQTQPGRRLTLTYGEVRQLPSVRRPHTLECISNEVGGDLISNANWRGVRLRDVLERAGGVNPKAIKIVFRCADGYTESLPLAEALNADTLLVYEINGEPLPPKHGFPVRLLVPGLFGMKNPKWITKIETADFDFQGFWEKSGWTDHAVVQTTSKFTAPPRVPRPNVGEEVGVGGAAYAGERGIKAVDVSWDDGKTWQPAQLKPPLGKYTWVLWALLWKPTGPGEYRLKVRARDGSGVVQVEQPSPTLPDGATGYHAIRVRVEK